MKVHPIRGGLCIEPERRPEHCEDKPQGCGESCEGGLEGVRRIAHDCKAIPFLG